ncbi:MAG: glycosyltransferase family 2 protein, partial [Candidatus Omnitrophica bacterium]|nr:glycosyltransferase family 2 protein [Candidatus Omnitrophota bacterium]
MTSSVSVIVPTYNEESVIHSTLEDLFSRHHPNQVIVVDGGSNDRTVELVLGFSKMSQTASPFPPQGVGGSVQNRALRTDPPRFLAEMGEDRGGGENIRQSPHPSLPPHSEAVPRRSVRCVRRQGGKESVGQIVPGTVTITVLHSIKGRAFQMNVGARHATGDVLLFLHADTRLPDNGLEQIKEVIGQGARAGRFRMKFDNRKRLLRLYETYTRFHFFSYGDQGFFVARELFEKLGGFDETVPFEDIDFYQRLRRMTKPVIIQDPVVTSARRFT